MSKRERGHYWVLLKHWRIATVAFWNGRDWRFTEAPLYPHVRKVVSERLTPPNALGVITPPRTKR